MEQKLAAVFADVAGSRATITLVCASWASRDTYYRCQRRFAAEGMTGLLPRSRAPKTSPTRTANR